jgi:hypothetical protein
MIGDRKFKDKVTVRFVRRTEGGLQAHCDIPGFYLSGADPRAVMSDVVPMIEFLFKRNLGISVEVYPLKQAVYQITERSDVETDVIPDERDYVIEKLAA